MSLKRLILLGIAAVAIIIVIIVFWTFKSSWAGWAKTRGIENFSSQDFEKAQTYLSIAKLLNGNDGETRAYLGYILNRQEDFEDALAEFQKAEALGFENAGFFRAYGWALRNLNQPEKAAEYYEKALSLAAPGYEQDAITREELIPLYFRLGENDKAISEANELLARLPESDTVTKAQVLELLARIFNQSNKQGEAINLLAGSIQEFKDDPRRARLYSNLAVAYLKAGQFAEAEKAASDALSIAPGESYPFPYCVLGAVYLYHQKDYGTSKKYLESGLRVRPVSSDNAYCFYLMGRLEKELGGNMNLAKQYFNEFLALPIDFTVPEFKMFKERTEEFLKEI